MQFSHSRIECFKNCQYQYQLRYLEKLETIHCPDFDNALILGTALHEGIEKGVKAGIDFYMNSFYVIDDKHINEIIKLEYWINEARKILPIQNGIFELPISNNDFIGFVDLLVPTENENEFDLYDFKYSNNQSRYMESGQLHEYKYFYEKCNPDKRIRNLFFVFIPKIAIRQKKTENLLQFRKRLKNELELKQIDIVEVKYNHDKVINFVSAFKTVLECKVYAKNITKLCDWCEYSGYCLEGDKTMLLPKNERRTINNVTKKKIWLYGEPCTGKTYLSNKFPSPLMLNTDGNIKFVDAPFIAIKDDVQVEGRQTRRTSAWEIFKNVIEELEKKENNFKTIIVDLLEDTYEHCRRYMYDKMDIEHESDAGFGKGYDVVRKEFLDTIKRLMNLDYENIILISHEDRSKDVTNKSGAKFTSISPNLSEKISNKIAGMVDIIGRTLEEDGQYTISFKTNEIIFGGSRLKLSVKEIPSEYSAICTLYGADNSLAVEVQKSEPKTEKPVSESTESTESSEDDEIDVPTLDSSNVESVEVEQPRTRKRRGE